MIAFPRKERGSDQSGRHIRVSNVPGRLSMKRLLLASVAIAAAAAFAVAPAQAKKPYQMRIGMVTINDSNHLLAKAFKRELEARAPGRIEVSVFPAAQLGKIPRQIEGLQFGTQAAFHIPPGFFLGINKAFMVSDAPGLFDSIDHQTLAMNHPSFRKKFFTLADKKGMVGNVVWGAGDTSVATLRPMKKLSDFRGRKIRVLATPLERAVMAKMGATGVPMPYSEVLPALTQKVIDGVRSAVLVMYPSKFYTAAKNITLTGMGHISCWQALSTAWMKTLPADLRALIVQVGKEQTIQASKWATELTASSEKAWAKVGTVHRLPAADQAKLAELVAPIGNEILANDPATKEMYLLLKTAVAETRGKPLSTVAEYLK